MIGARWCLAVFCFELLASAAWAESPRKKLGLLLSGQLEARVLGQRLGAPIQDIGNSWTVGPEVGLTIPIDSEGNEAKISVRRIGNSERMDWSAFVGRRGYFGDDEWRTFWDLDLAVHFIPKWSFGPRMGAGLQFRLVDGLEVYSAGHVLVAMGQELKFGASISVGLQIHFAGTFLDP